MAKTKIYLVNPDKLSCELEKRNLTKAIASREMGFCDSYISQVMQRGVISKVAARALENTYNISLADYELREAAPATPVAPPASAQLELDYVRLRNIIYDAVYSAVKKAWSE